MSVLGTKGGKEKTGEGRVPSFRRWANSRRVGSISSKPSGGAFVFLVRILGILRLVV